MAAKMFTRLMPNPYSASAAAVDPYLFRQISPDRVVFPARQRPEEVAGHRNESAAEQQADARAQRDEEESVERQREEVGRPRDEVQQQSRAARADLIDDVLEREVYG